MGVRGPGSCAEGEVDGAQECLLGGEERQSDCETLLPGGVGTARGAPRAVGLVGDLCAEGGQVLLALGLVDLGQECGAFVRQRPAAPAQVPGGTPVGGRARGLREPPTTQQRRHLWRVDLVVCGRATRAGLQRAGMAQDNREACMGPQVREPVPGAQALDRHDEPLSNGARVCRKASGSVCIWRGTRTSPRWSRRQRDMGRACRSMPQENGCGVVEKLSEGSSLFVTRVCPLCAYHGGLLRRGPQ